MAKEGCLLLILLLSFVSWPIYLMRKDNEAWHKIVFHDINKSLYYMRVFWRNLSEWAAYCSYLHHYVSLSQPCLSVMTPSCATSPSVGPSWMALPGSRLARMFSVISMGLASSAAHPPSARPAPLHCLGSWTLSGLSCRPLKTTKPWCWQVSDQT